MLCDKCINVEKTWQIDEYGNTIIRWECKMRWCVVYVQMNYSDTFLQKVKSGKWSKEDVYILSILPRNKKPNEVEKIEKIFEKQLDGCKRFREMVKPLERFL